MTHVLELPRHFDERFPCGEQLPELADPIVWHHHSRKASKFQKAGQRLRVLLIRLFLGLRDYGELVRADQLDLVDGVSDLVVEEIRILPDFERQLIRRHQLRTEGRKAL